METVIYGQLKIVGEDGNIVETKIKFPVNLAMMKKNIYQQYGKNCQIYFSNTNYDMGNVSINETNRIANAIRTFTFKTGIKLENKLFKRLLDIPQTFKYRHNEHERRVNADKLVKALRNPKSLNDRYFIAIPAGKYVEKGIYVTK